ncbi:hypothetical protein EJ03DRAFT_354078 [Teratosphaeria nubilosa]|uniref:Uncharacterized protein n=1 Tax=Teratosphaeria nubilosa TaxID=161662 RepID=A0A6G1L0F2_9PEZI|nr:hypothetical protein EJ03DRAFT_354078 [Teratosphaeria nubilosa]
MGSILSKVKRSTRSRVKRNNPLRAKGRVPPLPTHQRDDNNSSSAESPEQYVFPSMTNKQFIVPSTANQSGHPPTTTANTGRVPIIDQPKVNDPSDDESSNDSSVCWEDRFNLDDIEDPNLAGHFHEILTRMTREPDLLPKADEEDVGPERYKKYWRKIEFNERVFESGLGSLGSREVESVSPKTKSNQFQSRI